MSEYQAIHILMFIVKYKFTKKKEKYNNDPKSQASVIVHFKKLYLLMDFREREKEKGREGERE